MEEPGWAGWPTSELSRRLDLLGWTPLQYSSGLSLGMRETDRNSC